MKIAIQKGKIVSIINFMYEEVTVVRKQSRMRRAFIDLLKEKQEAYNKERTLILEENAQKDEKGKAIVKSNGDYDIVDTVAFYMDLKELNEEEIFIEGSDHREMLRTVKVMLRKLEDREYGGLKSEIYDYLCDQFELDEEETTASEGGEK
ncbi:hypothetical protein M3936_14290 [Sutcliffiella horikoshii]|uniref:hypothetical protein n=1 Tax=Sutcliffiella horikoshii TaxID=79883 RepID=UPI00203F5E30|nr:hypothetical protein [Sutcliffiella horikoshii]MCM3618757.1 hypothetical protein [Sutcliffiella horikoshii]